jgi:hypothetical protein
MMNDPHAKAILSAAAYNMGEDVKDGKFPRIKRKNIDRQREILAGVTRSRPTI